MLAISMVAKATVLIAAVAAVQLLLRRRASAATRHFVWTLAIAGVLAIPVMSVVLPAWTVEIPSQAASIAAPADAVVASSPLPPIVEMPSIERGVETAPPSTFAAAPSAGRSLGWRTIVAYLYGLGVVVMLARLIVQRRSVRRLVTQATRVEDAGWLRLMRACADGIGVDRPVQLLRSREESMPMAIGTLRPAVIVPAIADAWDEDRRRAVLLHELAHVARRDCLSQAVAMVSCAVYWFHPAAWWMARQLRIERELACDDRVIAAGTRARDYAAHLLEIAYAFGGYRAPALAVSMARPRQLEGRMLAVLDAARNRRIAPRWTRMAVAVLAAAVVVPLATMTAAAPATTATDTPAAAIEPVPSPEAAQSPQPSPATPRDQWREVKADLRSAARNVAREITAAVREVQDIAVPDSGTWEVQPAGKDGFVNLQMRTGRSNWGNTVELKQLEGLSAAQLSAGGPVKFRIRRDAGTFDFEGTARAGVAAGVYRFTANPEFSNELAKRGFGRPTALEQYRMARADVGFAFIDELARQGYGKPSLAELVRAADHGVHMTYLREMGELGYKLGTLEPLITLRDHGVTPRYVRELAEQGFKGLSADELRHARDHGITADYVKGMQAAGYKPALAQLIKARDHGVDPEFVKELRDAGHRDLSLDEVIRIRDHGVNGSYMRGMREQGYNVATTDLVRARDHGVTVEYIRDMAALGYARLPLDQLIKARDHGVTASYARELKDLGYDKIPLDDLIKLRDHGVTATRIRRANERAGTKLPLDVIRSLVAGGG